jgi:hypothetical protein
MEETLSGRLKCVGLQRNNRYSTQAALLGPRFVFVAINQIPKPNKRRQSLPPIMALNSAVSIRYPSAMALLMSSRIQVAVPRSGKDITVSVLYSSWSLTLPRRLSAVVPSSSELSSASREFDTSNDTACWSESLSDSTLSARMCEWGERFTLSRRDCDSFSDDFLEVLESPPAPPLIDGCLKCSGSTASFRKGCNNNSVASARSSGFRQKHCQHKDNELTETYHCV